MLASGKLCPLFSGQQKWNQAARRPGGSTVTVDQCDVIMRYSDCRETHRRQKICSPAARCTVCSSGMFSVARWAGNIRAAGREDERAGAARSSHAAIFSLLIRCTISTVRPPLYMLEWCVKPPWKYFIISIINYTNRACIISAIWDTSSMYPLFIYIILNLIFILRTRFSILNCKLLSR